MHDIGIYDSEKGQLVGQDERDPKSWKQNLRLITSSPNFKTNSKLIQLIIAVSFSSTDALSCSDPMVLQMRIHGSQEPSIPTCLSTSTWLSMPRLG